MTFSRPKRLPYGYPSSDQAIADGVPVSVIPKGVSGIDESKTILRTSAGNRIINLDFVKAGRNTHRGRS